MPAEIALLLQKYSFNIIHVPGRANLLPDFLSRNPQDTGTEFDIARDNERMFFAYIESDGENSHKPREVCTRAGQARLDRRPEPPYPNGDLT
ncbi:hypothetical protein JTB14_026981 [Gonioctena quinquepunctata]|nr:hypothetical protein JTB14_026981 [Gonioctena quinquepunctata]